MKKARVLLVGSEDEENLAIRYLGAMLKEQGYEVSLVPCARAIHFKQVLAKLKEFKPFLVGVSLAFQTFANMYFDLVKEIRKQNYTEHIVVGGHFPTFEYKRILETQSGIDSVIRFEGETPIVELADALRTGSDFKKVHNLVYKNNGRIFENECIHKFQNLDQLPFPMRDKTQKYMLGERFATLIASRGCWHSACLYCCIAAFHNQKKGKKFAIRSVENVAKEISELYHKLGIRAFQFHDDNFMLPTKEETLKRLTDLKNAIVSKNVDINKVAFIIKARPDSIDDETVSKLKELGVIGVFLGIENASESGLKNFVRFNTVEDVHRSLVILSKNNIIPTYNLLIFYPDATIKEIDENIELIKQYDHIRFDIARAEAVVGSPLEKLLINRGKLINLWPDSSYICEDVLVEKMFDLYVKLFRRKGSPYTKLTHCGISLSYHLGVIERLHPGPVTSELVLEGKKMIKDINLFILKYLETIRNLCEKKYSQQKLDRLYSEFRNGCEFYISEISNLSDRMLRLQVTEETFNKYGIKQVIQTKPLFRKIFKY